VLSQRYVTESKYQILIKHMFFIHASIEETCA